MFALPNALPGPLPALASEAQLLALEADLLAKYTEQLLRSASPLPGSPLPGSQRAGSPRPGSEATSGPAITPTWLAEQGWA